MQHTLYVASSSQSRQMLLRNARIPFTLITQDADESKCDWGLSLQQVVTGIARYKMAHVIMPHTHKEGNVAFVLTADTLTEDAQGKLEGKPKDRQDAIQMLKAARSGVRTGTAFCLRKMSYNGEKWTILDEVERYVASSYMFSVPDHLLDYYLDTVEVVGSGAIAIEGFGDQFLQSVQGSYSTIVGLPMYELRCELERLGWQRV